MSIFWFVPVLVGGFLIGSAATTLMFDYKRLELLSNPDTVIDRLTDLVQHDAGLTHTERQTIRSIVEEHCTRMTQIHPQIIVEIDDFEKKVLEVLTPRQRARWEPRFKRMRLLMLPL